MKTEETVAISTDRKSAQIEALQAKKLTARDKLRALRSEMQRLDQELCRAGADEGELQIACW